MLDTLCVEWQGATSGSRSPRPCIQVKVDGKWKTKYVTRWLWEKEIGPIPKGKMVLHTCDNPLCVSLEHLYVGTQSDNMRDMHERGRQGPQYYRKDTCKYGHDLTLPNARMGKRQRCRACAYKAVGYTWPKEV